MFHWWQQYTSPWYTTSHYAIENYTQYVGWEITTKGQLRYLYHHKCHALVPADTIENREWPGLVVERQQQDISKHEPR